MMLLCCSTPGFPPHPREPYRVEKQGLLEIRVIPLLGEASTEVFAVKEPRYVRDGGVIIATQLTQPETIFAEATPPMG